MDFETDEEIITIYWIREILVLLLLLKIHIKKE